MKNITSATLYLLLAILLFVAGCASTVFRPTEFTDRDLSGKFDGPWRVIVSKGAGIQYIENWEFTCADMSQEFDFTVKESTIVLSSEKSEAIAYVSRPGKFKISLPLTSKSKSSGNSDSSLSRAENTLILRGRLSDENGKGLFTIGVAEFANAGCTSSVKFERIPFELET